MRGSEVKTNLSGGSVLLVLLAGLWSTSAAAQQRGDWVLGRWQGGDYWFPGVVEQRSRNSVIVRYDDGTRETLGLGDLRPYSWRVGTAVQCRWAGGRDWYDGEIIGVSRDGTHIDVLYDDGDREQLATGACRSE
jgi:hypothetical protein